MKINKKNGFTLIELIIAIAIVTTVVFIGYKVINKSQLFSKEQSEINNVQLGFNNLRKYITEDFKESDEINSPNADSMDLDYVYQLINNGNSIDYKVEYKFKGENKLYSIKRIDGDKEFSFIENQPVKKLKGDTSKHEPPLIINYDEGKKIYSVQLNYGNLDTELYTFEVYNGDIKVAGGTPIPDIPDNNGIGGNLIKQYITQVDMFIQQIEYEARGNSFWKEIEACKENSRYIIDNFSELWKDKNLLKSKITDLTDAIETLYFKVNNGNSQHKIDIRYYINLSNIYLEKSIYVLNNQNYYNKRPDVTVDLIEDYTLNSSKEKNYVSLKSIKNYSLEQNIRNGTLQKIKTYLNTEGDSKISDLQIIISYIQTNNLYDKSYSGEYKPIDYINNDCLMPMYYPNNNITEDTIKTLSQEINKLINRLEYFKSVEINELLSKNNGKYKYFDKLNKQDTPCAEKLIKNIQQNISVVIEELKYMEYSLGVDI